MGAPKGNCNACKGVYDRKRLMDRANKLTAHKKRLYSKMDITSPMSKKEKLLNRRVANIYSQINSLIALERRMRK